jgi:hypothetical protein
MAMAKVPVRLIVSTVRDYGAGLCSIEDAARRSGLSRGTVNELKIGWDEHGDDWLVDAVAAYGELIDGD